METNETLERWTFNVETDMAVVAGCVLCYPPCFHERARVNVTAGPYAPRPAPHRESKAQKSEKAITSEIQAIIRQITASVTFLPLLQEPCTFDLLVYANDDAKVPQTWEESDPKYISNSQEVRLRSFTTKVHKVEARVSYKCQDDDV